MGGTLSAPTLRLSVRDHSVPGLSDHFGVTLCWRFRRYWLPLCAVLGRRRLDIIGSGSSFLVMKSLFINLLPSAFMSVTGKNFFVAVPSVSVLTVLEVVPIKQLRWSGVRSMALLYFSCERITLIYFSQSGTYLRLHSCHFSSIDFSVGTSSSLSVKIFWFVFSHGPPWLRSWLSLCGDSVGQLPAHTLYYIFFVSGSCL